VSNYSINLDFISVEFMIFNSNNYLTDTWICAQTFKFITINSKNLLFYNWNFIFYKVVLLARSTIPNECLSMVPTQKHVVISF